MRGQKTDELAALRAGWGTKNRALGFRGQRIPAHGLGGKPPNPLPNKKQLLDSVVSAKRRMFFCLLSSQISVSCPLQPLSAEPERSVFSPSSGAKRRMFTCLLSSQISVICFCPLKLCPL
ncbi:MAG: hypothetical protein LBD06_09535 [Candidatus Accumulibacter sp.]|nr:hypothetical protein [Accumulibacter sp.]